MAQFITPNARAATLENVLTHEGQASQTRNYYIETRILMVGQRIPKPGPEHFIDRKTVLVFADDRPLNNWEHQCRYILVDASTLHIYSIMPGRLPPYFFSQHPGSYGILKKSVFFPQELPCASFQLSATHTRAPGNRYAILYSSRSDACHFNDMAFLHQTLVEKYGYSSSNITLLNFDGCSKYSIESPGNLSLYAETLAMNGPGTKDELAKTIANLHLKSEDSLLIHTSNHGSWSPTEGSALLGKDEVESKVFASDLAGMLAGITVSYRQLIVMAQQCFSGGFLKPIADVSTAAQTCIASACQADKESRSGIQHNPFALHWISALAMRTPDGVPLGTGSPSNPDTNGDGLVSMREAFNFAYEHVLSDYGDVPQFHPATGTGGDLILGDKTLLFPEELPLLEPLIRSKWKAYDPEFDKQLRHKLTKLKRLEKRLQQEHDKAKSKALDAVEALLDD